MRNSREMLAKEQDLGIKIAAFPDVQWASVDYDEGEKKRAVFAKTAICQHFGDSSDRFTLKPQSD